MSQKCVILDGSGYVFRAYYGMPPLEDDQGRPVQAIYGFFRMLFQLLKTKPEYFVIAWDSPKRTLRKEQFEDYKANRTKMPDEFKYQMGSIKEIVGSLGIPYIEEPGYEADDIIGTIVNHPSFNQDNAHFQIVSSDKDLKQLLRPGVSVLDSLKQEETNVDRFRLDYGYEPHLIVDYLSLVGDASDNIKGVMGIGAKGAEKLVKTYGDLDSIYEHIDEITGATKQKLIDGKRSAYASKTLIQLMYVPGREDKQMTGFRLQYDFDHMRRVLLEDWKFAGLAKSLQELKKEVAGGTQLGLFG